MLTYNTITFNGISKTISQTNTAERLSDVDIFTTELELYFPSGNSGTIKFGGESLASNPDSFIPRNYTLPGMMSLNAEKLETGEYRLFNLRELYVYGTSGDQIIVQYRTMLDGN